MYSYMKMILKIRNLMKCSEASSEQRISSEPEIGPVSVGDQRIRSDQKLSDAKTGPNALKFCELH